MRRAPTLLMILTTLTGCPGGGPDPDPQPTPSPVEGPAWCDEGRARSITHGRRNQPIGVYPDDHYTLPDEDTRTGLRVHMEFDQNRELLPFFPEEWGFLFDEISTLDGWGLTSGIVFRFEFALDPDAVTPEQIAIVAFEEDGPVRYAADVETTLFPDTVIARPRQPLPPSTTVAAMLLQGPLSSDGTCIRQGEHLRELLSPASELAPGVPAHVLSPRYIEALEALEIGPEDVAHMTVFTTQSTLYDSLDVLEDVGSRAYSLNDDVTCETKNDGRLECDATLTVMDYRGDDRIVDEVFDGTPQSEYDLPIRIALPGPVEDGPYPVAMTGHGLAGDRNDGSSAVREFADMGIAVVATDAIEHGEHPTRSSNDGSVLDLVLNFFAVSANPTPTIAPRVLRDNFRQSSWDRLQVIEAIRQGLDVNGDGDADLDADRMMYFGASLGGMMGSETMALTPDFLGGMLGIAGGRITSIVTNSDTFGALLDLMVPEEYADDDLQRIVPIIQALIDGGDPMVWARYIVRDRLVGDPLDPPQLLVQYAFQDEVVPNVASRNHAHGLGIPLVGRELFPLEELEQTPGPVQGNLPNGGTAAMMILDMGRPANDPGAEPQPVDHAGSLRTYEAELVWRAFLEAGVAGDVGVVFDPYLED